MENRSDKKRAPRPAVKKTAYPVKGEGAGAKALSGQDRSGQAAAKRFVTESTFKADPFGSYTGHTKDGPEQPVQDADDI